MTENHSSDWPRKKTNGESSERREPPVDGVERGKEKLVQHQRRRRSIKVKVVPLDHRANEARQNNSAKRAVLGGVHELNFSKPGRRRNPIVESPILIIIR